MTEGNVFTLSTIFLGRGGVPCLRSDWGEPHPRSGQGGYTIPGLDGRVPYPADGVPHPRSGWGVPHSRSGLGYPILGLDGVPHPKSGWGVSPSQTGWGTPCPRLDGYPQSKTGWGTPCPRLDGVFPIQNWMGYPLPHPRLDAMQQAVCLLHSCRRTFLFRRVILHVSKHLLLHTRYCCIYLSLHLALYSQDVVL